MGGCPQPPLLQGCAWDALRRSRILLAWMGNSASLDDATIEVAQGAHVAVMIEQDSRVINVPDR